MIKVSNQDPDMKVSLCRIVEINNEDEVIPRKDFDKQENLRENFLTEDDENNVEDN